MLLTTTNLVHYLIARGSIGPEAVVEETLRILEFGRRNVNFKVDLGDESGLFVKQMAGLFEGEGGGLSREVACHNLARSHPANAPLLRLMPRLVDHDPARHCLVVELIRPGEDLREIDDRLGHLPESLGRSLGRALARLHALGPSLVERPEDLAAFPRLRPWILDPFDDIEVFFLDINPSQRKILADIQALPELVYGIDGLRRAWSPSTLIHGDLKLDNIMARLFRDDSEPGVWFVDWELADFGDPAWDVAGLFETFLEHHLHHCPAEVLLPGRAELGSAFATIAAFWGEYARGMGLAPDREAAFRTRCVHFLGAKLLLLAFEQLVNHPEPTSLTATLPRMARFIMADTSRAGEHFLGFGPASGLLG